MKATGKNDLAVRDEDLDHPRTHRAFRTVKLLIGAYLAISVLTLVAAFLLRGNADEVNDTVWVRGTIVVISALPTFAFAARAARGSRRAFRRLRIISAVMVVAIIVIVSLPGLIPLWMKIEQGVCALLLAGVAVIVNGGRLRALFAAPSRPL
ncbi:hypothetical protein [Actinomadura xylanilytica]|uniref:hypothetical protein n=1 Tax=Actinomadura xylanilytica TaxID=887459 RepID=UPI00255B08E3|nr:hypothetical protein [Actinomadura xylanilytica]MDL4773749.1 hypothetical protein [Actinomadura xylanilytica]